MGISLSLKGADIANDGYVAVDDIGVYSGVDIDDTNALLCHTNKTDCCRNPEQLGNWHLPDGNIVQARSQSDRMTDFLARNRGAGVVRLYRVGSPTDRGRFYCVVPNAADIDQTIYVNLCKLNV